MCTGWHEYEENRLDVHDGLSSESEHMAFYTVNNLTSATLVSRSEGFYIRLRAALHRRDNINFVYTLVTNSTEGNVDLLFFKYIFISQQHMLITICMYLTILMVIKE